MAIDAQRRQVIEQMLDFRDIGFTVYGGIRRNLVAENFSHAHGQDALLEDSLPFYDNVVGFLQSIQMHVPIHPSVRSNHRLGGIPRTPLDLFYLARREQLFSVE